MYKYLALLSLLLFFTACSVTQPKVTAEPKPNQKVFEQEDLYILFALEAEHIHDYNSAAKLFLTLYEKAHKKEYLYRALENELRLQKYEKVIATVDENLQQNRPDPELMRLKVIALSKLSKIEEAKKLALSLAAMTQKASDYILVSNIYAQKKEYDLALKYLEGAYVKEYNEDILDKMAIILYVNLGRKKDAIAQLESHTRIHGCSERICLRLVSFYSDENNIDGLLSVYKRMYAKYKREEIAQKIIQIYTYKREYFKLIDFLEANHIDDAMLLNIYASVKDYKKASEVAKKLYTENGDIIYLGQSALYAYEVEQKNISQEKLQKIISDLKKVVSKQPKDTLYLNYLGYILIDHDIDLKRGLQYIQRALAIEPNSPYYLDSLAWAYYKLGDCKKAYKVMQKVIELGEGEQAEVKEHIRKIKQCLQNSKKGK
jgi:tetratricopeptide (TPR) repeat protein